MARKEIIYQGLADLSVLVEDTSLNSPDYFRVSKMPTELTAGKNTFRFKGNAALFAEGTSVYIEILDSNGEPIYYETGLDLESSEQNAIVTVFITEDVPPGTGYVILCSTATQTVDGKFLDTSQINLRWTTPIYIDASKTSDTEIIFDELPEVTVYASTGSYTNLGYPGGSRFATASLTELIYYKRNDTAVLVTSSIAPTAFDTNALSGTITINTSNLSKSTPEVFGTISTSQYSSSFTVLDKGAILLDTPISLDVFNSISKLEPSAVNVSSASIEYELSASLSSQTTENSYNLAVVYFSNLVPQTGTISKIRSYYRSSGVGEYIFSNETNIDNLSSDFGFNVNVISASFAVPTIQRNDRFDFKFEFVNPAGSVSKQVIESKNNLFLGGNTYIGGDDNLLTGSLYVAGNTGTGVHVSGKGSAAMLRSIGYTGFANATGVGGTGGFVLYSGSIQSILGASEDYSGVGLELVANSSSYFKYTTSGSGKLDIRTNNFFIGTTSTFLSGSNGNLEILNRTGTTPSTYLTKFRLQTNGSVTASAFIASTGSYDTSSYQMMNTAIGLIDGKNIGRTLFHVHPQTLFTNTSTSVLQAATSSAASNTTAEILNSGSYATPYVSWSLAADQPVYVLPFENAFTVFSSAVARKDSTGGSDANLMMLFRITAWLPQSGSTSFESYGNPVTSSLGSNLGGVSGSIYGNASTLGTSAILNIVESVGVTNASSIIKSVIYLPNSAQDRIIYVRVEYAPFRIPRSASAYGTDFNFSLRLGSIVGIIGRSLQATSTSGNNQYQDYQTVFLPA